MYCSSCGRSLSPNKDIVNIAESSSSVSPPDSECIGRKILPYTAVATEFARWPHLLFGHLSQLSFIYV